jgi:hypothetical protein
MNIQTNKEARSQWVGEGGGVAVRVLEYRNHGLFMFINFLLFAALTLVSNHFINVFLELLLSHVTAVDKGRFCAVKTGCGYFKQTSDRETGRTEKHCTKGFYIESCLKQPISRREPTSFE